MKTSLALNYKEAMSGKKGQKTFTDINPNATSQEILTFTTAVNALTTNIYESTDRIQVINVDTEEVNNNG